jgi:hypothetical protein
VTDDEDDEVCDSDEEEDNKHADFDPNRFVPKVPHKKERVLDIYVWGKALRDKCPSQLKIGKHNNYNAAVLKTKKKGVDWTQCGADPAVRKAVMQSGGFLQLLEHVIKDVETFEHTVIGINCRKGRHRSSTLAHLVKHCFYPQSRLHFLEPGSNEQRKFSWT